MRRILLLTCVTALGLSLAVGSAAAAPTQARNYEAIPATCDGLGDIVIEVVNLGNWGTGKVQGTRLTLIPRSFTFSATNVDTGEVVFEDSVQKRNAAVDDVCRFSFVEEVPEGDPEVPAGTYLLEGTVGVKVVGGR